MVEELLKRALEKEPKHKDIRRQLGWALFVQQSTMNNHHSARANEDKPFDNYSYNLMGRVHWARETIVRPVAFRKQLEITHWMQRARESSRMLVEWRKYKEAIPELEQAISSMRARNAYVSLGSAYLNLSESAKGIQAFEKAVKLSPGPLIWNDVAYNLALNKVQLEKAQQYAESAVTTTAAELRNAEVEQLTLRDLGRVSALAAYWDTLGWVYYQKGDAVNAEKYIRAAWNLVQHSEVGCHLAEILEKSGKKDEAAQTYALAAMASRLVPEAMEGLVRMVGKPRSEQIMKAPPDESRNMRTIKFASGQKTLKASEAQFYVVLVPGPQRTAQVDAVRFIGGDAKLQSLGTGLKTANFNFSFPDSTSTRSFAGVRYSAIQPTANVRSS